MSREIRDIISIPDQLTVEESALILSAFNYRVTLSGNILLSVPHPIGYVFWLPRWKPLGGLTFKEDSTLFMDYTSSAIAFLNDHNITPIS